MWCGVVQCGVVWCGASLTNVNKPEETGLARCMSAELTVYPSSPARKVGSGFAFSRKINIRNYEMLEFCSGVLGNLGEV